MSDLQEHISASFSAQGLMATLGAELVRVAQGEVRIALLPRPELSSNTATFMLALSPVCLIALVATLP